MNAKKILIVEDDKMLCTIFQMFIQELNYEIVATVRTGEDAISACETYSDIDVILMDIHLDGNIDGVETARRISQKRTTPIIFITGDSSPETIESATLENVYGFMTKPVYKRNLGVAIEYAFAKFKKA
ncbi:MAG: response regulator [Bacteroidales bacterium]|nr:response regulator [Bacteroidales bacterium]